MKMHGEKKGRDMIDSVLWQKPLHRPTEKSKKQSDNIKAPQKIDYTTIADRLSMVSWGNDSHPTGVVKPVNGIPTLPLTTTVV